MDLEEVQKIAAATTDEIVKYFSGFSTAELRRMAPYLKTRDELLTFIRSLGTAWVVSVTVAASTPQSLLNLIDKNYKALTQIYERYPEASDLVQPDFETMRALLESYLIGYEYTTPVETQPQDLQNVLESLKNVTRSVRLAVLKVRKRNTPRVVGLEETRSFVMDYKSIPELIAANEDNDRLLLDLILIATLYNVNLDDKLIRDELVRNIPYLVFV